MQTKRKLLNSQEAAEYLGLSLSYFRKMMMRRVIPMYKPSGKLCFFDPDDLDAYLTSIRISSQTTQRAGSPPPPKNQNQKTPRPLTRRKFGL